jgi:hypothetical protein
MVNGTPPKWRGAVPLGKGDIGMRHRPPLILVFVWALLSVMVLVVFLSLVFVFLGLIYFCLFHPDAFTPTVPHI